MGVLVRTETQADARRLAQGKAGNEGLGIYSRWGLDEDEVAEDVWLSKSGRRAMSSPAQASPESSS